MAKEKINLEEITALTKEIYHAQYAGEPEKWFIYLCPDSVYLGTGEPLLLGSDAIRERFKGFTGITAEIVKEDYFPIRLGSQAAHVCGEIIVQSPHATRRAITHFTTGWRIIGGNPKIVHLHNSYEYMQQWNDSTQEEGKVLKLDVNTAKFVRNLLLEYPSGQRMPIRSGTKTVFVNPHSVLYVQSQRNRSELVCVDRVITCNSPLHELARELPGVFYPLRRGYLVNTLYVVAIRRFEAELISGISIPIPALTYTQVKKDLQELIKGNAQR